MYCPIFTQVVAEAGYDPLKAGVRLNWKPKRPELRVEDVLDAFESGLIDRDEARRILADMGWNIQA